MKKMHMAVEWARKYSWFAMVFLFKRITVDGVVVYLGLEPPTWTDSRTFHVGRFNRTRIFCGNVSHYISWLISWFRFRQEIYPRYPRHRIEIKLLQEKKADVSFRFFREDHAQTLIVLDSQYTLVYLRGEGKKYIDRPWAIAKAKDEKMTWAAELDAFQAWLEKEATELLEKEKNGSRLDFGFYQAQVIHKKAAQLLKIPAEVLNFPKDY
ncbi:MAG: hypothetical protein WC508_03290 [Patescibacteria group bacterium]